MSVWQSLVPIPIVITIYRMLLLPSHYTVSISGLDPDSPQPQPWQSKIVAGNEDDELYYQQLQGESKKSGISKSMYIALRAIRNK